MNYDSFPEENSLSKELTILKSQDEMAQVLILEEIERRRQEGGEEESSFSLMNMPHASSHPH